MGLLQVVKSPGAVVDLGMRILPRPFAKSTVRTASSLLGWQPFTVPFKRPDLNAILKFLEECERIPTVAHGMDVLKMRSLMEWCWNKDAISRRKSPYTHKLLRPYLFFPGLSATMVFGSEQFAWAKKLEDSYETIRDEVLSALEKRVGFQPYREVEGDKLLKDWAMLHFYVGEKRIEENAALCPKTVELVEAIPGRSPHGFVALSALNPGRVIAPHFGVRNGVVRVHYGVIGCNQKCYLRVGDRIVQWEDGKSLIFDDSFEHQVCHNGDRTRIVLWFDVQHPDWPEADFEIFKDLMRHYIGGLDWNDETERVWKKDREVLKGQRWWAS